MKKNNSKKIHLRVGELARSFAEDKDVARQIRIKFIKPAVENGKRVVLDFKGVAVSTQSFIHAMISEAILNHGTKALRLLEFKSCNPTVKSVILTVIDYCLEMRQNSSAAARKKNGPSKRT